MGVVHEDRLVGLADRFKTNIHCHHLLTTLIRKVTVCHAIPPLLTKDDTNSMTLQSSCSTGAMLCGERLADYSPEDGRRKKLS
ncbi:MAG: hypothetical protein K0S79_2268 [Nitrospira sp.]|nr:hypothetical protein [Nitrospira sp.]